ncbi:MAG TPA: ribosome maturation factor RimM [Thermoanaerobaculia bacterium]|nr:ribosome maturation factor RimM [Thermoanaerobaculia bacterium]
MSSRSSRTDLPDTVLVGRILRPHGVRGELVVQVLTDVLDRLQPGSSLLLADGEAVPRPRAGFGGSLEVVACRPHKSGALVRFAGVEDRDRAEGLRDGFLAVPRSRVPAAEPGTYYHYELLGCRCRDGGRELGTVVDLLEDGGGLLLIVEGAAEEGRRQVPVPFVQSFIREIDVVGGTIDLDLPPGLLETCASTS